MGFFQNIPNVYDMGGQQRRRNGLDDMNMQQQGGAQLQRDSMQNQDPMRMHQGVALGQSAAGGPAMAKRGRTPGTKVLRRCPECTNQIPAALSKCPHCNKIFREKKQKGTRSGKRGKKICPKCQFENPAATSTCKNCPHVFRLKITEKYNNIVLNKAAHSKAGMVAQNQNMVHKQQMNNMRMGGTGMDNMSMGMNGGGLGAGSAYGISVPNSGMMIHGGGNNNVNAHNGMPGGNHSVYGSFHGIGGMPGLGGVGGIGGLGQGLGGLSSLSSGLGGRGGAQDHKLDGMHRGRQPTMQ